jgi:hypothetical protein
MSAGSGHIEEDFGGEIRRFCVRIGELRKIQDRSGAGPAQIAERLARCVTTYTTNPQATPLQLVSLGLGDWRVDDIREPIFQGLIGAGMNPNLAGKLIREWVDERGFRGLVENAGLALTLVVAGVEAPAGEGESGAGETAPPDPSISEPSTETEPPLASPPGKSTN